MKLDQMFPRKFATGEDLKGQILTLTIQRVTSEKVHPQPGSPAVDKFAVWFQGATKGIILSRTLATQIADATGSDDTDLWTGKRVTLYPQPMTVAGKDRVAIRARKATNGETPAPATLQEDEEDELNS